jgi:hypothetical protein
MTGHRYFAIRSALLITEPTLRELHSFVAKHMPSIKYKMRCEGGLTLSPESLDDVLSYENATFQRIQSLSMECSRDSTSNVRLDVNIGSPTMPFLGVADSTLYFDDTAWAYGFHGEMKRRLLAARPWFWPISSINFTILLPLLIILTQLTAGLILTILNLLGKYTPHTSGSSNSLPEWIYLLVLVVASFVGGCIDYIKGKFFPRVFFCIGRQAKTFRLRQAFLYLIFAVIALGIIINIVSSLIMKISGG